VWGYAGLVCEAACSSETCGLIVASPFFAGQPCSCAESSPVTLVTSCVGRDWEVWASGGGGNCETKLGGQRGFQTFSQSCFTGRMVPPPRRRLNHTWPWGCWAGFFFLEVGVGLAIRLR
jgi:hypothetical protein